MTTGQSSVQAPAPIPEGGACHFDHRRGKRKMKKMKRACCCIVFLLLINAFLLMHTAKSVGAIMWFMLNGSYTYDDTTYIFVPGGAKTLCNDLCVDMCIYRTVGCDLNSCLNTCNQQLVDDGNVDDFQQLPTHPIAEDMIVDMPPMEEMPGDGAPEGIDLIDTPQAPEYDEDSNQAKLAKMQHVIEVAAEAIRQLKAKYEQNCAQTPDRFGCNLTKQSIKKSIESLKKQIGRYNSFAISVEIDIQVEVWMLDVDEVTAEP